MMNKLLTKQAFQRLIKRAAQLAVPASEKDETPSCKDCTDMQTHLHNAEDTSEQPSDTSH